MTNDELIAALEGAEGPDKWLLEKAACACGWREHNHRWDRFDDLARVEAWEQIALTLVPEGWGWEMYSYGGAGVYPDGMAHAQFYRGHAATPALALCIAALRARASS